MMSMTDRKCWTHRTGPLQSYPATNGISKPEEHVLVVAFEATSLYAQSFGRNLIALRLLIVDLTLFLHPSAIWNVPFSRDYTFRDTCLDEPWYLIA